MNTPSIVFAGTPDFALASLRALVECGHTPLGVLTQPDRRAGRGRQLTASPVKRYALENEIEVRQPTTLKDADAIDWLTALRPDVIVVAAYGLLLPSTVLELPAKGCVNVHASLLPRWRGAAPIQAAILAGDAETGISLMQMDVGLDTGPVYVRSAVPINAETTAAELHDTLAELGGRLLCEHLDDIVAGTLTAARQDDDLATHAGKISPHDARIDWCQPAPLLARLVRAYNPVPGARFIHADETIKCWRARAGSGVGAPPGTVLSADGDGVAVACGEGVLFLEELQRPGRRAVTAQEFSAQLALCHQRFE